MNTTPDSSVIPGNRREMIAAKAAGWLVLVSIMVVLALGGLDVANHGWGPRISTPTAKVAPAVAK